LGIERFEVMAELLSKRQGMIGWGSGRFRHSNQKDDTRNIAVVTTGWAVSFIGLFGLSCLFG
jgi:hypothetical protein